MKSKRKRENNEKKNIKYQSGLMNLVQTTTTQQNNAIHDNEKQNNAI